MSLKLSDYTRGLVVQWVKPLKDGKWSIAKSHTEIWPKVGDLDIVLENVGGSITLENLRRKGYHYIRDEWFVGPENGHFEIIGWL